MPLADYGAALSRAMATARAWFFARSASRSRGAGIPMSRALATVSPPGPERRFKVRRARVRSIYVPAIVIGPGCGLLAGDWSAPRP